MPQQLAAAVVVAELVACHPGHLTAEAVAVAAEVNTPTKVSEPLAKAMTVALVAMVTRHIAAQEVAAQEQLVLQVEAHQQTVAQDLHISRPRMAVAVVVVETVLLQAELGAQEAAAQEELEPHLL